LNHYKKYLTTFNYSWIAERWLVTVGVFFSKKIVIGIHLGEI